MSGELISRDAAVAICDATMNDLRSQFADAVGIVIKRQIEAIPIAPLSIADHARVTVRPLVWSDIAEGYEAVCEVGIYSVGVLDGYITAIWRCLDPVSVIADETIGRGASIAGGKAICEKHRSARILACLTVQP